MDQTTAQVTLPEAAPVAASERTTEAGAGETAAPAMSKNAMKKAAKAERIAAQKLERRAREKEMRKEKKRVLAQKRAAGELDENEEEKLRAPKRPRMSKEKPFCQLVVDLGFDDKMSDNEVKSLASQLGYTYSANRRAPTPFKLLFTGLGGRTLARLESQNNASYKRWQGTEWWAEEYDRLWAEAGAGEPTGTSASASNAETAPTAEPASLAEAASTADPASTGHAALPAEASAPTIAGGTGEPSSADAAIVQQQPASSSPHASAPSSTSAPPSSSHPAPLTARMTAPQPSVVYLTADSDVELSELKEDETYIIGGICDHNRYKNLCLNKAKATGIRTARLPIGRYLAHMPTRKVLTVNQVVEIMCKWVETRDWEQALLAVMPKRKFQQQRGAKGAEAEAEADGGEEAGGDGKGEEGREEGEEGDKEAGEGRG